MQWQCWNHVLIKDFKISCRSPGGNSWKSEPGGATPTGLDLRWVGRDKVLSNPLSIPVHPRLIQSLNAAGALVRSRAQEPVDPHRPKELAGDERRWTGMKEDAHHPTSALRHSVSAKGDEGCPAENLSRAASTAESGLRLACPNATDPMKC
jgi:hypothetical protein